MRKLVHTDFYTKYQVLLYLQQVEPVLKRCKVAKYYDQDCLKNFLFLSTLSMIIQVSEKSYILASKRVYRRTTNSQS